MIDNVRNELLLIMSYAKNEEEKDYYIKEILQQFEYDIKDKLKDVEREKAKLEYELEVLEYVRKELSIK